MPLAKPDKKQEKRPRVLLLPPSALPIPAVRGGAVETLITHLIRENERQGKLDILCASVQDPDAKAAGRKTEYSLIAVWKNGVLINMDSQAPNRAAWEWMSGRDAPFSLVDLRREVTHGDSRFDLAFSPEDPDGSRTEAFMEVKGVTLEENGVARFPDAPTERGVKHLNELARCQADGYEAAVCFVLQMAGMKDFAPNDRTHPAFGDALRQAAQAGVRIMARECIVTPDSLTIGAAVPVLL